MSVNCKSQMVQPFSSLVKLTECMPLGIGANKNVVCNSPDCGIVSVAISLSNVILSFSMVKR